jgi:hypothetical protein
MRWMTTSVVVRRTTDGIGQHVSRHLERKLIHKVFRQRNEHLAERALTGVVTNRTVNERLADGLDFHFKFNALNFYQDHNDPCTTPWALCPS